MVCDEDIVCDLQEACREAGGFGADRDFGVVLDDGTRTCWFVSSV